MFKNGICHGKINLANNLRESTWYYFISKVLDLIDTVFFVLRKKQNQVSVAVKHGMGTI